MCHMGSLEGDLGGNGDHDHNGCAGSHFDSVREVKSLWETSCTGRHALVKQHVRVLLSPAPLAPP
jgi:hypothetical protein